MRKEVVWVRVAAIAGVPLTTLLIGLGGVVVVGRFALSIVEDDDFVNAEDGEGAGDLSC